MTATIEIAILNSDEALQKQLNGKANFIAQFYTRLLNERTEEIPSVRIQIYTDVEIESEKVLPPDNLSDWYTVQKKHLFAEDANTKTLLEVTQQTLLSVCTQFGLDAQAFQETYEQIHKLDFRNCYYYGKVKTSPNRKQKAALQIEVQEEYATISVEVGSKEETETTKTQLIRTLPHLMFIYRFVDKLTWLDAETIEVSNRSGEFVFTVKWQEAKASLQLHPQTELPYLIHELGQSLPDGMML